MANSRHRSVALIVAVKVVIVVAVLALPSWLAVSLGAAHGVALALVAVAAVVVLAVRARRSRNRQPSGERRLPVISEARVETEDASRYLVRLCRHATKMGGHLPHGRALAEHPRPDVLDVAFTDTHGTLDLSWGRCVLDAGPAALTVRVEAATEERLRGIQDIVTADLERSGRRDGLSVVWQPPVVLADGD